MDVPRLEAWLAGRLGADSVRIGEPGRPDGGYSGETLILPTVVRRGGHEIADRYVLRREPPEAAIYPAQSPTVTVEVELQWRVLWALAEHSDLPVAPAVGYEADPSVLGGPFFVTGFVDGEVPRETPAYVVEGFFAEASPQRRRDMCLTAVRTVAAVNRVDWRAAGLDDLVPAEERPEHVRQLDLWRAFAEQELRGRPHPTLWEAFDRLVDGIPDPGEPALCWGDCRLGNMFWDGTTPTCLTDFEGATIAPAEFDLGWFLSFDRWIHEGCGNPRLTGEPSREELVEVYAGALGRPVVGVRWQECFGALRYCAIVVRVLNRLEERGDLPPDSDLYLAGGVVDTLRMLLDDDDGTGGD
ncbi:MAG: phosphotransferase family protein [Actinomycetota bacterium]|nr:phosphotransferase family protein [Actinomycetota bacterium]MED5232646.1 phosphotransferase family protein [Actinomycetota bacterium]MED5394878.1 phosphotransferase family protein [Actinomycetota bacterium]